MAKKAIDRRGLGDATYASWLERNDQALEGLRYGLELTDGWALWPVVLPEPREEAARSVSYLGAWWAERVGGFLEPVPMDRFHARVAAPRVLYALCGEDDAGRHAAFGREFRPGPSPRLRAGDGVIVYHTGLAWTRSGDPVPAWRAALQSFNFMRDIMVRQLGGPLLWAGPPDVIVETSDGAADLWSVREVPTVIR